MNRFCNKPEYFFRPLQVLRRVRAALSEDPLSREIKMPWGDALVVNPNETIGRALYHTGVYDLVLSECLWRLCEGQMKVLDIGANIGYFSSLLASRVGSSGKVLSFEPHPLLFEKLKKNLKEHPCCQFFNVGLSEKNGTFDLFIPENFSGNEGVATLEVCESNLISGRRIPVTVERLDDIIGNEKIHLIKIDVEGHELSVFKGGERVLKDVENILFEDFKHTQSPAIHWLKKSGFEVFRLKKNFFGPEIISIEEGEKIPLWEPPNYLATRDITSAKKKLSPRGWQCLL
jgi:FkbM family methyltransferase